MPPKKKEAGGPNKKTVEKKKEKVIEDKTFGLKNKKGTKQQKFIKTVTHQVKSSNTAKKPTEELPAKKKDDKKKEQEALNLLFKPVTQTVGKGVDPKSVLCAFFKQGQCKKGDKCKFSHDLNISRKGEKRSAYADAGDPEEDTMDKWDTDKLEDVINKKHGEENLAKPKTAIICKFFVEAVENSKYGWFWECPNGEKCFYKHTLPPGFALKKDQKKDNKEDEISIEELIEKERAALGHYTTKVTLETFLKWKERKKREKMEISNWETDRKKAEFKAGKTLGISGREMFEFNPDLVIQDDDEADEGTVRYQEIEEEEEDTPVHEINLDMLAAEASENDGTGTISTPQSRKGATNQLNASSLPDDERGKLDEAAALPPTDPHLETDAALAAAMSATLNGEEVADVPIDEDLFDGEDLDQLEDDLDSLDLDQ